MRLFLFALHSPFPLEFGADSRGFFLCRRWQLTPTKRLKLCSRPRPSLLLPRAEAPCLTTRSRTSWRRIATFSRNLTRLGMRTCCFKKKQNVGEMGHETRCLWLCMSFLTASIQYNKSRSQAGQIDIPSLVTLWTECLSANNSFTQTDRKTESILTHLATTESRRWSRSPSV